MNVGRLVARWRLAAATVLTIGLAAIVTGRMAPEACPSRVRFEVSYSLADRSGPVRALIDCVPGLRCGVPIVALVGALGAFVLMLWSCATCTGPYRWAAE